MSNSANTKKVPAPNLPSVKPSVKQKPKQSFRKLPVDKIIGLSGLAIMLMGVVVGSTLVQQNQELRKSAKTFEVSKLKQESDSSYVNVRSLVKEGTDIYSGSPVDETKRPESKEEPIEDKKTDEISSTTYNTVNFPRIRQNVYVIIYDTHTDFPARPYNNPEILTKQLEDSLELASIEKGYLQPNEYTHHSPNVDFMITGIQIHNTPAPSYNEIINQNGLCEISAPRYDEVWLWADRDGGFHESVMFGPADQVFDTNGAPIIRNDCGRGRHMMGFNYENGVHFALHSFSHRIENTIALFLDGKNRFLVDEDDNYTQFSGNNYGDLFGHWNGNTHFTPNFGGEYVYNDRGNYIVVDNADYKYWTPQHNPTSEHSLDCRTWRCREKNYHIQWMQNMPARCLASGMTLLNGSRMPNWWHLILKSQFVYHNDSCPIPAPDPDPPAPCQPWDTLTPISFCDKFFSHQFPYYRLYFDLTNIQQVDIKSAYIKARSTNGNGTTTIGYDNNNCGAFNPATHSTLPITNSSYEYLDITSDIKDLAGKYVSIDGGSQIGVDFDPKQELYLCID